MNHCIRDIRARQGVKGGAAFDFILRTTLQLAQKKALFNEKMSGQTDSEGLTGPDLDLNLSYVNSSMILNKKTDLRSIHQQLEDILTNKVTMQL